MGLACDIPWKDLRLLLPFLFISCRLGSVALWGQNLNPQHHGHYHIHKTSQVDVSAISCQFLKDVMGAECTTNTAKYTQPPK